MTDNVCANRRPPLLRASELGALLSGSAYHHRLVSDMNSKIFTSGCS